MTFFPPHDALCLSNALGNGSGLVGASRIEIFECVCVFIRWGFNVFLQERREGFLFFFLVGGMNSVQCVCFFYISLKGGEREDMWRDEHCHSVLWSACSFKRGEFL